MHNINQSTRELHMLCVYVHVSCTHWKNYLSSSVCRHEGNLKFFMLCFCCR